MLKRHKFWMASFVILAALVFGYPAVAEWSKTGAWDTATQIFGKDNTWTGTQTFDSRVIVPIGTKTLPGLTITDKDGSLDNGFFMHASAADQVEMSLGDTRSYIWSTLFFQSVAGVGLMNESPSGTNPVFVPKTSDLDTGIGSSGVDQLSFIAGEKEAIRIIENDTGDISVSVGGTAPGLSSCGTTPSVTGSDTAGKLTIGTGATTSCTVTFTNAFATNAPACVIAGDNTAITYAATTSTTVLTITSSGDMASDVISYICLGIL